MNRPRTDRTRRLVTGRSSLLLVSVLAAACESGGDGESQRAQCACVPDQYLCLVDDGSRCRIDEASGSYDISAASDVAVRSGSAEYTVRDGATLTLRDGKAYVDAGARAAVLVDGGIVFRGRVLETAAFTLTGGVAADLNVEENATMEVGGGEVYRLQLAGSSATTLYGGTSLSIDVQAAATLAVAGGAVDDAIHAIDRSAVTVSEGVVHVITADGESNTRVEGGSVEVLATRRQASATVTGGAIRYLSADNGPWEQRSTVTVVGSDFNYPYGLVDHSTLALADNGKTREGRLTGTLANGDQLDTQVFLGSEAILYLCPPDASSDCSCPLPAYQQGTCAVAAQ